MDVWIDIFLLQGNILYFDLDIIVFRNIDELFTYNPRQVYDY